MTLDALNNAVNRAGGTWLKLRTTQDPAVDGSIIDFEERDRRDPDGNVILSRKTNKPRLEWVITLQCEPEGDDDDGVRKLAANESMQRAIADAIKASGKPAAIGGTLKVKVSEDPEDNYSQATYKAVYVPPPAIDLEDF